MSAKVEIFAAIRAKLELAGDAGGGASFSLPMDTRLRELLDGTGDYQISKMFVDTRTIAASSNEDLDLSGALVGPLASSAVFTKIKGIYVKASKANVNNVVVKPGASNGFLGPFGGASHTLSLTPGDVFLATRMKDGWTVTAGTGDLLNVANSGSGSGVDYDIVLFGI